MIKQKNGDIKSQIHFYCKSDLYSDFKEAVKKYNDTENANISMSEIIRGLMADFIQQTNNNGGA